MTASSKSDESASGVDSRQLFAPYMGLDQFLNGKCSLIVAKDKDRDLFLMNANRTHWLLSLRELIQTGAVEFKRNIWGHYCMLSVCSLPTSDPGSSPGMLWNISLMQLLWMETNLLAEKQCRKHVMVMRLISWNSSAAQTCSVGSELNGKSFTTIH